MPEVNTLLLCSYNILAQAYVEHQRGYGIPEPFLERKHRWMLIRKQLQKQDWQVMCLQEVDGYSVGLLSDQFPEHTIFYSQRPSGKEDGLAILVHKDIQCLSQGTITLPASEQKLGNRLLQYVDLFWKERVVKIVNIHISWNAPQAKHSRGCIEMKAIVEWVVKQEETVVLCGDCNAEQGEEVLNLVLKDMRLALHPLLQRENVTYWGAGEFQAIDHVLIDHNLDGRVIELTNASNMLFSPNHSEGSDHFLVGVELFWKQEHRGKR